MKSVLSSDFFKKNAIFIAVIFIFIVYTLPVAINESSFFDSAWAWYLAKIINPDNWCKILANERHCILWYLILKPFAIKDFFYPYSLQIINWLFCFASIIVLWKKSSSSTLLKTIITFSFVVTQFFAVIARCYSIGLLGLFLLIFMQKNSLRHPVVYTLLLGITANTSAMAVIPVSALTLIFIYDVIKERKTLDKKSIIISFAVLAVLFSFIIIPFTGSIEWAQEYEKTGAIGVLKEIYTMIVPDKNMFAFFAAGGISIISYILFIAKGGKAKFFVIYTTLLLYLLMSYVYTGTITHKLFFTVYIILAVLLQNEDNKYSKFLPVFYVCFALLLFMPQDIREIKGIKVNRDLGFYMIKSGNIFENSYVVFEEPDYKYTLIPYILQNKKITLLDNDENFELGYTMERFHGEEPYIKYAKEHDKPLYLITHYEYKDYKPAMIFENKYHDDDGCDRYIYKLN